MTDHPFAALLDLIEFDQEIRRASQEIDQLKEEVTALRAQEEQAGEALTIAEEKVVEQRKGVSALELRLKEIDDLESHKKKQLDELSEYKEYRALKSEIDMLQRERQEKEDALLASINKLESAQKELDMQRSAHDEKVGSLRASISENEQKVKALEKDIKAHESVRPEKEQRVPDEWRDKYSMMRMRVPDPVVPVLDASCSSCFQAITSQAMIRVKSRALVQCQGCFRLLYSQELMGGAEKEQAA